MKLYLIKADLETSHTPYYIFCVEAKDEEEAEKLASKIVRKDYGQEMGELSSIIEIKNLKKLKEELIVKI